MPTAVARRVRLEKKTRRAILIRRYKRFLADVRLPGGQELTVHCPNSGAMTSCCKPGRPVVLSDSGNPKRKLRYTWEMIKMGRTWVGVHSAWSNRLVGQSISAGLIAELAGYDQMRREVKYGRNGGSRADLVLARSPSSGRGQGPERCFVEVKHCSMRVGHQAAFPDAVTERGRKHPLDLMAQKSAGDRAVLFILVGRNDCRLWRPADEVDLAYGQTLRQALQAGVELLVYRARFDPTGAVLTRPLPVVFPELPGA